MTILQALAGHYDRLTREEDPERRPPEYGFSMEKISFAIVLSSSGGVVDIQPLLDTSGKTPKPSLQSVPQAVVRTAGVTPNFLWDKTAYVFGIKRDRDTNEIIQTEREYTEFREFHQRLLQGTADAGLVALSKFLEIWKPEKFHDLPNADEMADTNIIIRFDGEMRFVHERPAAQRIWLDHLDAMTKQDGLFRPCLVSGEIAPSERLHSKIKGVRGAQFFGASIVSFNLDAFSSYGKVQGDNAPVSKPAAFAYTTALNELLAFDSRQRIQIGDTTTVFWASASKDAAAANSAENFFSMVLNPQATDESETAEVSKKLEDIAKGRPLELVEPKVDENTRFHVLGLAPNASRLSIRFWFEDSIGSLSRRIGEHFHDLRIKPAPWNMPPAAWRLLLETAVQGKAENIPPTLNGVLMQAILTGGRYPRSLAANIVMRLRADSQEKSLGHRVAILKAWLVRDQRIHKQTKKENYLVSLDKESNDIAYNLGRLFAGYAYAEKSYADRNASIRDKYMGAASSTPRRVFPVLMKGYEHNRSGLAKGGGLKAGAGVRTEIAIGEIMERLPGSVDLPTSLSLEDQARFFIGYYHQERAFYTKSDSHDGDVDHEELV